MPLRAQPRPTGPQASKLAAQVMRYEAVHPFGGWEDLRARLAPDRRVFAFFHARRAARQPARAAPAAGPLRSMVQAWVMAFSCGAPGAGAEPAAQILAERCWTGITWSSQSTAAVPVAAGVNRTWCRGAMLSAACAPSACPRSPWWCCTRRCSRASPHPWPKCSTAALLARRPSRAALFCALPPARR